MRPPDWKRREKFIELCAQGKESYRAAIEAGYSPKYAKPYSHILRAKCEKEIAALKPVADKAKQETFIEQIQYTAKDCYREFEEVRALALLPDDKGNYRNLSAAAKAIENKGRLVGAYEADNSQKAVKLPCIQVATEEEKDLLEDI